MSYLGQQLGQGQAERFVFTASGGETSVTTSDDGRAIAYTVGQVDVYLNGAKLINGSDFTATTGTSITGLAALTASDVVEVFALSIFQASDTVSAASGGTFNGNVTVDANLTVTGTVDIDTSLNVDGTVTADGLDVDGTGTYLLSLNNTSQDTRIELSKSGTQYGQVSVGTDQLNLVATGASTAMRFLVNSGSTEAARITSAGDVGIGVTPSAWGSPFSSVMQFTKGAIAGQSNSILLLNNAYFDGTNYKYISTAGAGIYEQTSGIHLWQTAASGTAGTNISFSESMRIDSSGNLLVGKTSTGYSANGAEITSTGLLYLPAGSASAPAITFSGDTNTGIGFGGADILYFTNGGSESGRFDASGNLLVGKTTTAGAFNTVGTELRATGLVQSTVDGSKCIDLNRKTSDGDIIGFSKDGTTVGSIGTRTGRLTIGEGDVGLEFVSASDQIRPHNMTSNANRGDAIDLGESGARFKDLYLSGGVVFGSTGGAVTSKTLDDYEEGTFTPVLAGSSTAGAFTYALQEGRYVKVGESVHVHIAIQVTATSTSPVGDMKINGLPFTIGPSFPSFAIGWTQYITFADQIGAYGGGTTITLRNLASGGSGSNIQGSAFASDFFIFIAGTYEAA
jgi:hypothetical protein